MMSRNILIMILIGLVFNVKCQTKTNQTSPYAKTDEETAAILKDFQSKPELLLCIGIFTKIPKEYLDKKITPLKELVNNEKVFGKYVDRYFFNAILSCVNNAKKAEQEKVIKF